MATPVVASFSEDDALIAAAEQGERAGWRVYRLDRTVIVLGRGSRAEREVDLAACERDGVPLLRRRGGGCTVVLDPGNVIVSVCLPLEGISGNLCQLHRLSDWLGEGLKRLGAEGVERQGICDLAQAGRKISGACLYRARGLLYYSATVLVEARLELLGRYLLHPPREPDYRAGRPHEEFVGALRLPRPLPAAEVAAALSAGLAPLSSLGCAEAGR
ncbi:MAG: hypothetical protein IPL40_02625 [Proteobacteria bacterium]|nr:hypothetical protein [Pseudomonadota bacterium]